jgi:hypothetical protein
MMNEKYNKTREKDSNLKANDNRRERSNNKMRTQAESKKKSD